MENTNNVKNETSEREVKIFTTPDGKELVIKAYINGWENRKIRKLLFQGQKQVTNADGTTRFESSTDSVERIDGLEDVLIETIVVSYAGLTENLLDAVMKQNQKESLFVIEKCNEVFTPPKNDPKEQTA